MNIEQMNVESRSAGKLLLRRGKISLTVRLNRSFYSFSAFRIPPLRLRSGTSFGCI